MNTQTLSILENAIEPYHKVRYTIISQTESSITLCAPARRFSWALFLLSLLVWPLAVIYLVWFSLRRGDRTVCVRVTSQGLIEESGFTLDMFQKEQQRQFILKVILIIFAFLVVITLFVIYQISQGRNNKFRSEAIIQTESSIT